MVCSSHDADGAVVAGTVSWGVAGAGVATIVADVVGVDPADPDGDGSARSPWVQPARAPHAATPTKAIRHVEERRCIPPSTPGASVPFTQPSA